MNKELIDRVWKYYLPKEFKEAVKKEWQTANDEERFPHDAFLRGCYSTMVLLFGYHNLTSDAEGEDEMLCVSRKEVIRNFKEQVAWKNHHQSSQHDRDIAMGWCNALQFLFGSKCLPDEEPQPAEPKEKPSNSTELKSQESDKHFYNILKNGFSKERRLNIAAMITQGIMANPNPQMVEMDVHRVAGLAILMADTLIAECEKGGQK